MAKNIRKLFLLLLCLIFTVSCSTNTTEGSESGTQTDDGVSAIIAERDALNAEIDALNSRIAELETKLAAAMADADAEALARIEQLKAEVQAKQERVDELEADIARYGDAFEVDVIKQAQLITEIYDYIEHNCPVAKRFIEDEEIDEDTKFCEDKDGNKFVWVSVNELIEEERALVLSEDAPLFTEEELAESGLSEEELTELCLRERVFAREDIGKASVGLYYEDILTGYHFGYNEATAFGAASVIKAPYVVSVLQAVSADEEAYIASLAEKGELPEKIDTDKDGKPDRYVIEYSDPIYDLYEVVKYDSKTMKRDGSGVIKDMEDGTEFTYLDFMNYAITESDNVAYSQLRDRFGYDTMRAFARNAGAGISNNSMTPEGAGSMFRQIWEFCEENETYGSTVYEAMRKAGHRVIIPLAVSGKTVLHKYGWDEEFYNDAGIVVSGDRPYVVTLFSDMSCGGDEVNAFMREIVKKIDALHVGFAGK